MKAYLEPEEIDLMEQAATNVRDRLLIRLLFHVGCRISEALSLTVDDVDFDAGTVRIQHLKTRLRLNCSHCGARLSRSHSFCAKCGVRIE
jgi:integrase/recombinase XerD